LLVTLMPEVGHDALATHLFVPQFISANGQWHFDPSVYVWSVTPMLVTWLYSIAVMFAGESAARLVNLGGLFLLAMLVARITCWAGGTKKNIAWSTVLFLSTPLVFLITSSAFIDAFWAALVVGGTLAFFYAILGRESDSSKLVLSAILLGGAVAAKAVTLTLLPALLALAVLKIRVLLDARARTATALALFIFILIGSVPYLTAYLKTGNPVFPFFNGFFKSPFYPAENFSPPPYEQGLHWNTLYRVTFESGRYIEGTLGAAGFHWLLVFIPCLAVALMSHRRKLLILVFVLVIWVALVFSQTAYLRYVLPAFAISFGLVAALGDFENRASHMYMRAITVSLAGVVLLNLLHFHSSTWYGAINADVLLKTEARARYQTIVTPQRAAVEAVNAINITRSPVAVVGPPLVAGLTADAVHASWYNPTFSKELGMTSSSADVARLLSRRAIDFVIIDESDRRTELIGLVVGATVELARFGSVSVRKLDSTLLFKTELLPGGGFTSGWTWADPKALLSNGSVIVTEKLPATIPVAVSADEPFLYTARLRCHTQPTAARLQVNWLGSAGEFLGASIDVVACETEPKDYSLKVRAPVGAATAVVYASAHEQIPVVFDNVSFRK